MKRFLLTPGLVALLFVVSATAAFADHGGTHVTLSGVTVTCGGVTATINVDGPASTTFVFTGLVARTGTDPYSGGTLLGSSTGGTGTGVPFSVTRSISWTPLTSGVFSWAGNATAFTGSTSHGFVTVNSTVDCNPSHPRASVHTRFSIDGGWTDNLTVYRGWGAGGSEFGCEWDPTPLGVAPDGSVSYSVWAPHIHSEASHGFVYEFGRDGQLMRGCSLVDVPEPWQNYDVGTIELRTASAVRIGDAG